MNCVLKNQSFNFELHLYINTVHPYQPQYPFYYKDFWVNINSCLNVLVYHKTTAVLCFNTSYFVKYAVWKWDRSCSRFLKTMCPLLFYWHYLLIILSIHETQFMPTFLFLRLKCFSSWLSFTFNTTRHLSFAQLAHCFSEIKEEPHCRHFSPCQKCILLHQSAAH